MAVGTHASRPIEQQHQIWIQPLGGRAGAHCDLGKSQLNSFKKSLLQSCSYLPIVVLPLFQAIKGVPSRPGVAGAALLYLLPLSYCGVFSFFAWHGGLCLNLRYLLPILPFTSILTAWAWRELRKGRRGNWRRSVTFVGLPTVILFSLFALPNTGELTPAHEFWLLTFPLLIAGLISALVFFHLLISQRSPWISRLLATTVLGAMFWSGLVVFTYDYRTLSSVSLLQFQVV